MALGFLGVVVLSSAEVKRKKMKMMKKMKMRTMIMMLIHQGGKPITDLQWQSLEGGSTVFNLTKVAHTSSAVKSNTGKRLYMLTDNN